MTLQWVIEKCAKADYETYSEAGHVWNEEKQSWVAPRGSSKKGLSAVGSAAYAEHPSTDILTFSYRLPHWPAGLVKRWRPGQPNPQELFDWLAAGGLLECQNVFFERMIWLHVAMRLYGWPALNPKQLRCSMAKAHVNNLPGGLDAMGQVLPVKIRKDPDGKRLLNKFSVPRKPTKNDPRKRIRPEEDPEDGEKLYLYCDGDVLAEEDASGCMMPMSAAELEFWQLDQEINFRGVGVDREGVRNMIAVLEQAQDRYGAELAALTGGVKPSEVQALRGWLAGRGVFMDALDADAIEETLPKVTDPAARRALEIRQLVGSASVKKLYAFERCASSDNRVRNTIVHHGARTGRPTGELLQPLNLPKAGPDLIWCEHCGEPSKFPPVVCPWCSKRMHPLQKAKAWGDLPKGREGVPHIEAVQAVMATRSLDVVEHFFGDALLSISGCIRGSIVAGEGKELIASDYSAIEAVVTAALSGCQWRLDAFAARKDIYYASASKITGKSYEWYLEYRKEMGSHHPDRQKIGKPAELGLGFGGWLTAWRQFDSTDTFTDDEVKKNILAWRAASPEIVEMWGGQARGRGRDYRLERFGFEGAFINAVQYPGTRFESHGIGFYMRGDALIIQLLSGRELVYASPRLWPNDERGASQLAITYMTWNSNPKYGPVGWVAMKTYAGRIAENIVQATAHDIQRFGILALEAAGYPIVLHVYDENIGEVPVGYGSMEEFERIMSTMPWWAQGWPIFASGGWRGKRYRKG